MYFTFVRNPVTWHQSRWAGSYARNNHPVKLVNQPGFGFADEAELGDFRLWLGNVLDRTSLTTLYEGYLDGMDFIGKTENLSNDLLAALDQAGETYKRRFINTERRNESVVLDRWYTRPLLKKVIEVNYDVMKRFDYPTNWRAYSDSVA